MRTALSDRGAMLGSGLGVSQCAPLGARPLRQKDVRRAISFPGISDQITIGNVAPLNNIVSLTLEGWFKLDQTSGLRWLINKYVGGIGVGLWLQSNSRLWFDYNASSLSVGFVPGLTWHFLCATTEVNVGRKIFVDAQLKASDGVYPSSGSLPLLVSGSGNGVGRLIGQSYGVRCYNRALQPSEIAEHYRGIYSNNDGLVGRWDLDEPDGLTAYDKSGYGNHGTLVGNPQRVQVFRPERLL